MHDADAGRARQHNPEPTGLWQVPGVHVVAVGAPPGDRVVGAVSVVTLGFIETVIDTYHRAAMR